MTGDGYIAAAIIISAVITFLLRAFPFLVFRGEHKLPDILDRLGKLLPSAVMAVLIIYCLKDVKTDIIHTGIPEIAGVIATAVSYKLRHNTFLSIILGTACCMVLMQFM